MRRWRTNGKWTCSVHRVCCQAVRSLYTYHSLCAYRPRPPWHITVQPYPSMAWLLSAEKSALQNKPAAQAPRAPWALISKKHRPELRTSVCSPHKISSLRRPCGRLRSVSAGRSMCSGIGNVATQSSVLEGTSKIPSPSGKGLR
jgi:hypothetical protein